MAQDLGWTDQINIVKTMDFSFSASVRWAHTHACFIFFWELCANEEIQRSRGREQRKMGRDQVEWCVLERGGGRDQNQNWRTHCYLRLRPGTLPFVKIRVAKTQRVWNCQSGAMRIADSLPEMKMSKTKQPSLGGLIVRRENSRTSTRRRTSTLPPQGGAQDLHPSF